MYQSIHNRAINLILCSGFWPVVTLNQGGLQRSSLLSTPDTLTQEVRSFARIITKRLDSHEMVGSGIILFLQWEALHDWGVAVVPRRSKWERLSGHVWSRIGAGRMGECRKYGLGRALRTLRPKLVVS